MPGGSQDVSSTKYDHGTVIPASDAGSLAAGAIADYDKDGTPDLFGVKVGDPETDSGMAEVVVLGGAKVS